MANPVVLLSTGDVIGPNSSVDGTMVLYDGTSGKKIKGNNAVVTPQGLALLDDIDAASNRATIGLGNVNNTSDINKPVSTAQQTALDTKANKGANSDITSITGLTTALSVAQGGTGVTTLAALEAAIGTTNVDNTSDVNKPVSTAQATAIALKANKGANSDITSITGLTTALSVAQGGTGVTTLAALEAAIGTTNVDNTSDVNKPVSTAQQTALNLKANLASPNFTGNPTVPTQAVGDDSDKAASTAFVKNLNYQANLNYTPVQQGGGIGQSGNKVYMGWSASGVKVTVDSTDYGVLVFGGANATISSLSGLTTALSVSQGGTGVTTLAALESAIGTTNVDNTSDINKPVSTAQQTALNLKANLASPGLTGFPSTPTPAVGVNNLQIANASFVKNSGTTLGSVFSYNVSTTLPPAVVGGLVQFFGSATSQTLTLPLTTAASIRDADVVTLNNYTDNNLIISRQGAENIFTGGGSSRTSMTIRPGESLVLVAITAGWLVIGGTGANQFAGGFAALLAANGYQKLPSGLIIQAGQITLAGNQAVTFPIVYPTACQSVVTNVVTTSNLNVTCNVGFLNVSNFSAFPTYANAVAAMAISWISLGY